MAWVEPLTFYTALLLSVTGMQLTNLNIKGQLSSHIQNLKNLTILNIFGNPELTGPIPSYLGNLTELVILDLHGNGFNGSIPDSYHQLNRLQFLDLSGNQIDGAILRWLGDLTQLQRLDLSNNHFSGTLPVASPNNAIGLNNLTFAVQMSFSNNNLTGQLDDLNTLSNLRTLNGSMNHFDGTFPVALLNVGSMTPKLAVLDLSNNEITGELPSFSILGLREMYFHLVVYLVPKYTQMCQRLNFSAFNFFFGHE